METTMIQEKTRRVADIVEALMDAANCAGEIREIVQVELYSVRKSQAVTTDAAT